MGCELMSMLSSAAATAAVTLVSSQVLAQATPQPSGASTYPNAQSLPAQTNPPRAANQPQELRRFALGISVGLGPYGAGTYRSSCEGAECGATTAGVRRYSHDTEEILILQGFYQPFGFLRFGPVIGLSTATRAKFTDVNPKTSLTFGNIFSFDLAVEATPRVGNRVWLLPRVQAGLLLLPPSDALKSRFDSYRVACNNGGFRGCDSLDAPKLGFNLGLGFGVLLAANENFRFRFDALGEYYSLRLFRLEAGSAATTYGESINGARLGILIGMEL
jgi:hypothetical protein